MKKRKVRINAAGVSSKYGYIVDEFEDMALIKVGCSTDWVKASPNRTALYSGQTYTKKSNHVKKGAEKNDTRQ